jgi:hypothetical protein
MSLPAFGEDCVSLKTPELVEILEGDRQVELWWRDMQPESLTCVHEPKLGTTQSPWRGNATMTSGGFYAGACDFTYKFTVVVSDSVVFRWTEVDWVTGAQPRRTLTIRDTDTPYSLSDGMTVTALSGTLYEITDSERWTPADPTFHGVYTGGTDSTYDIPVGFTLVCELGGSVSGSGGGDVVVDWSDDAGGSGSINIETAGVDYEIDKGLLVSFPEDTYEAGDTLLMDALRPFVSNDQFSMWVETFDGYHVLRRSVEDRPGVYKVVADISRCDTAAFFLPVDGIRYFVDKGIRGGGEGVIPDPDAPTVLNGFPYYYAVVTYDVLDDPENPGKLVRSPIEDIKVYPTPPAGGSVEGVYVVPNPYVFNAGWEESANGGTESKLQFLNVPQGAEIRIFDAAGNYIQTVYPEMKLDGETQSGRAEWNLKNASGRGIISGVYIYYITAGGSEKIGRFVVIR